MKTTERIGITIILIIILATAVSSASILEEGFESGNVSTWGCHGAGGINISAENSEVINGSFSGHSGFGGANWDYCYHDFANQTSNFTATFYVKVKADEPIIWFADGDLAHDWLLGPAFQFFCNVNNDWQYYDGAYRTLVDTCPVNDTDEFNILFHRNGAGQYLMNVKIDGVLRKTNASPRAGPVDKIDGIAVSARDAADYSIYDDILICPGNWNESCKSAAGAPPAGGTNFTITAHNNKTAAAINTFNATMINTTGTYNFGTTTGTINTGILNTSGIYNITVNTTKAYTYYNNNYNVSNNLNAPITPHIIINATNGLSGLNLSNFTVNIDGNNYSNTTGYTIIPPYGNTTENIIYYKNGYRTRTYNNINLKNVTYHTGQLFETMAQLSIYVYNYLGSQLLTSISMYINHTGTTTTDNPYLTGLYNYINETNPEVNIRLNITDLLYQHIPMSFNLTVNYSQYNLSVNMTETDLTLNFVNSSGSPVNTTGHIVEFNNLTNFNSSPLIVIYQSLEEGRINIRFRRTGFRNHTQYYEFNNEQNSSVSETIEILEYADWSGYFKVLDYSEAPIEDAVIRASCRRMNGSAWYGSWSSIQLVGQRLTDPEGETFFFFDRYSECVLQVNADGYSQADLQLTVGDHSYSEDNPKKIYLTETGITSFNGAFVLLPYVVYLKNETIYGRVHALGRDRVQIQTPYRISLGKGMKDITNTGNAVLGVYPFTLESGEDYNSGTGDIIVSVYLNNLFYRNLTITHDIDTKTGLFTDTSFTTIDSNITKVLLFIALLLATIATGFLLHSPTAGMHTFLIGSITLGLVLESVFAFFGALAILYYYSLLVRRFISE